MFDWYNDFKEKMVLLNIDAVLKMIQIINMIRINRNILNDKVLSEDINNLLEMNAKTNAAFRNYVDFTIKIETEGAIFSKLDLFDELDLIANNHDLQQAYYLNMLKYVYGLVEKEQVSIYNDTNNKIKEEIDFNDEQIKLLRLGRSLYE